MSGHKKTAKSTAIISLISNAGLAIAKCVTGILGHSDALIADAIESTADVFASVLVLLLRSYQLMLFQMLRIFKY